MLRTNSCKLTLDTQTVPRSGVKSELPIFSASWLHSAIFELCRQLLTDHLHHINWTWLSLKAPTFCSVGLRGIETEITTRAANTTRVHGALTTWCGTLLFQNGKWLVDNSRYQCYGKQVAQLFPWQIKAIVTAQLQPCLLFRNAFAGVWEDGLRVEIVEWLKGFWFSIDDFTAISAMKL